MAITVIDVSRYQAGLDLTVFKAQGGVAVIAKASQGSTIVDASFSTFRSGAKAAGLAFASYHYLDASDPAAQASFYLTCAAPLSGERVCADWEAAGVSAAMVVSFLKAVAAARPDLQLTVYSGASAKAGIDEASSAWLGANTSLWLAQYTTGAPSWPTATWKNWSLWQFSDSMQIAGWSAALDASEFNGSNANLLKWIGPASAPAPAPVPAPAVATVTITTSGPVTLIVNGVKIATTA